MAGVRAQATSLICATSLVCAVELTALLAALCSGRSPQVVALLLGAFHAGYLVAEPLRRKVTVNGRMLMVVTCLSAGSLCYLQLGGSPYPAVLGMFVFNTVAQSLRRGLKPTTPISSKTKNTAKAVGIVVGGVLGAVPGAPLILMLAGLTIFGEPAAGPPAKAQAATKPVDTLAQMLLWGELAHHAHYFAYCYVFWYLQPSLIGVWTGVWFLLGWLAYFVTERLWRERRRTFAPKMIAAGHLLVAGALVAMTQLPPTGVLIAWFITGIGGGTAYMLGNVTQPGPRERYEDTGHVLGVAIAGLAGALAANSHAAGKVAVLAGAGLAVCTAMIFLVIAARLDGEAKRQIRDIECA